MSEALFPHKLLLAQLEQARQRRQTLTYRQLLEVLALPAPAMRRLTGALEQLADQDAARGWPLRAALVVSQAGSGLPREGFFEHLLHAGWLPAGTQKAGWPDWHAAELEQVFAFSYPGEN